VVFNQVFHLPSSKRIAHATPLFDLTDQTDLAYHFQSALEKKKKERRIALPF
jgi:hypothetical protein